jgi:hypothetical protein
MPVLAEDEGVTIVSLAGLNRNIPTLVWLPDDLAQLTSAVRPEHEGVSWARGRTTAQDTVGQALLAAWALVANDRTGSNAP